jgi:hypothetical protein
MVEVGWFEAIGLLLVLVASSFKLFFGDDLAEIHQGVLQLRLEEKIDYVFMTLAHHHRKSSPEDSKVAGALNLDGIEKNWKKTTPDSRAGLQAAWFRGAENYAFLVGSLLLIGAKVLPLLWPGRFVNT